MGTDGVFMAEPVSNVIGGSLCFITMLVTILPELNKWETPDKQKSPQYLSIFNYRITLQKL